MKRLLYTLLLLIACIHAKAQHPMRDWLTSMPDSVMPLLTKNNRLDFVDFFDARMEAVVSNRLDGKSRMDTLTDDYLLIRYTGISDVAMKLLPVNDTADVLCMVTTINTMPGDSRIAFYDAQWRPLDVASYITVPCMDDFRPDQQGDSARWAWNKLDIFFCAYHLSAEDTGLKCTFTATERLSEEEKEEVMPYVSKSPLVYRWVDGKYQRHE